MLLLLLIFIFQKRNTGSLDICATGLRVKISTKSENTTKSTNEGEITPFHNIAVWSAVKFTVSQEDGGAAFLPLITSPENIDKSLLFQPLRWVKEMICVLLISSGHISDINFLFSMCSVCILVSFPIRFSGCLNKHAKAE